MKMKKILLLIFSFMFAFIISGQSVHAGGISPITFNVESYFDEFNHIDTVITDAQYGSTLQFDASLASSAGYTFKYWVINNVVEFNSAIADEFNIVEGMSVKALFSPSDAHLAVFLDSNGKFLDLNYVVDGETAVADGGFTEPTKPGYSVTASKWDKSLTNITEDTVFILQYEKTTTDTFTLSVANGSGSGTYNFNTEVTVVADAPPAEQVFSHWEDANAAIVSYASSYKLTVLADKSITAVYAASAPTAVPLVATQEVSLRAGYYSYLSQLSIPAGYTIIEYGIVASVQEKLPSLSYSNCEHVYRAPLMNSNTLEYVSSVPDNLLFARSYLVVRDGFGGIITYYGPLVSYVPVGSSAMIFETNGGSTIKPVVQVEGSAVSLPTNPSKDGYDFSGWYSDSGLTTPYTFTIMPVDNVTIYAKWTSYLSYTLKEDSTYEVIGHLGETKNIVIPSTYLGIAVTSIGISAFDTYGLTEVVISEGVLEIKDYAFYDNSNLINVTLPTSLTTIGVMSFFNDVSLSSINIPISVSTIGQYTFTYCEAATLSIDSAGKPDGWADDWNYMGGVEVWGLAPSTDTSTITFDSNEGSAVDSILQIEYTAVTEPANPTKDGYGFDGWFSDVELTTPYAFTSMPVNDLTLYASWTSYLTYTLKFDSTYEVTGRVGNTLDIVVPSYYLGVAVTSIGVGAFIEDIELTSIVISEGILEIKDHAFENDPNLGSLILPHSLTTIGSSAFAFCTSLSSIIIPISVSTVGVFVFEMCTFTTINIESPIKPPGWEPIWNAQGGIEVWGYVG